MRQLLPTTGIKRSKIKQTGRNAGFGCWLPAPNPWYCFSFPGKWGVCSVHSVSLRKDILDFPLGWNKCHRPPFTKVPGVPWLPHSRRGTSQPVQAAITKYNRPSSLWTGEMYFPQLWSQGSPRSWHHQILCLERAHLLDLHSVFSMCPQWWKGWRSSLGLFCRGTNCIHDGSTLMT